MTPDPAPLAMTCLLANPRRLRRLTQQKSYSSIAFILRICKKLLNAFNKPIEKWKKQIWDQLQSWGYAGCTSSWVSLNLTTCRTKAAWQKPFLPTDSVLPLGHQHTPHTLSPNMSVPMMDDLVVLGYPRDHSLRYWRQHRPRVKVDSQPSGISQTYNHLAPRKRNLQGKREKKNKTLKKRVVLLSLPHLMTFQISPREPRSATSPRRMPMAPLLEEVAPEPSAGKIIMSIINL